MTFISKKLILAGIGILGLIPVTSYADEHWAANLSPTEVQRAVNAASPGDTVILPAGDYSGFNRTVDVPNGISLRGQGKNSTILRNTSGTIFLFSWNDNRTTSSYKVRISGFQLIGHGDGSESGINLQNMSDFAVSGLIIRDFAGVGIGVRGNSRGVIYDCELINICQSDLLGTGYGVAVYGDGLWDDPKPPLGTQNAVFVEDSHFSGCKHGMESNGGAHYVFRHNKVEGLKHNAQGVDVHGKQSSHPCGGNTYEIYNNTIIGTEPSTQTDLGIVVRGGDGVIYNNTISKCEAGNRPKAIAISIDNHGSYPDKYQVRELYIWGNTHNGSAITDVFVTDEASSYIKKGREYFMTAKPGYTAYAYPHPLRSSSVGPEVSISASPVSGIAPLTVNFSSQVSGGSSPYTYSWSFDDGGSSTSANPSHTYSSAGTYTAELTVRDSQGSTAGDAITITATATAQPLSAAATAIPRTGQVPLYVKFSSSVSGGVSPYTYSWSFGDGGSSTSANPSHTYSSEGTYTARFTVRDSQGTTASDSVTITATATPQPLSAEAAATPLTGQAPLYVKFSSTVSGGVSPYTYSWSFGDGGSSTSANPSHTYSSEGTYTARLNVRDSQGSTTSDSIAIKATATPQPLSAEAAATPRTGQAPLYVRFSGSASGGVSPYSFSWSFGDGAYWGYQNPSHTYTTAGEYTATLTVRDSLRTAVRVSVTITVTAEPADLVAIALASPQAGAPPLIVAFTGDAEGGTAPYSFSWSFGDGGSSSARNPTHTYSASGTYSSILTVTDAASSTATSTLTITVSTGATFNLAVSTTTGAPAPGQGGTTSPSPGTHPYAKGSYAHVKAVPKTDYRFSRWAGTIPVTGTYSTPLHITMDKNRTVNATFCTKCGDINGDLKITPADAQAAFDLFLKKTTNPTLCEAENADVNGSGTATTPQITPADAQGIFNKYLKKADLESNCSGTARTAAGPFLPVDPLGTVGLEVHQTFSQWGEELVIPVIVDSLIPMGAFGFDLSFPQPGVSFVGLDGAEATSSFTQVGAQLLSPGVLRVGGYAVDPVYPAAPYLLVTLVFRVNRRIPDPFPFSILATYDDLLRVRVLEGVIPGPTPKKEPPDKRSRQKDPRS
jgi:PKD repeat protein